MKTIILITILIFITSCGYHLRSHNSLAQTYPNIKLSISAQSTLKRELVSVLIASGVKLQQESTVQMVELKIIKDTLRKVVQSIGANNQVQEYRLEYEVQYSLDDKQIKSLHLEKDYSLIFSKSVAANKKKLL
ncbi:MAG: hypothetical protein L3J83_07675 [Proteobacteria bacterium]|nr:hypothetical protein [Pseudomonadota bacterium]